MQNWKKEGDYPSDTATSEEWAWEFIRRNKTYGTNFKKSQKLLKELENKYGPISKWNKIKFKREHPEEFVFTPRKKKSQTVKEWINYCLHNLKIPPQQYLHHVYMARDWGLCHMYDPSLKFSLEKILFIPDRYQPYPKLVEFIEELDECPLDAEVDKAIITLDKDVMIFDLNKPISPQTKKAFQILQKRQKAIKEIPSSKDKHSTNDPPLWRNYLRILDAKNEKPQVTEPQIAKHLFPDAKKNASGKVKEAFRQAKAMVKDCSRIPLS
jgi:hypothetical protein